jgi:cell division cycle protein 37
MFVKETGLIFISVLPQMEKTNQRIRVLEHDLKKLQTDDDDDDDDLGEGDGIRAELAELKHANQLRQAKLDDYERNKKWNVDNICHVTEERTVISRSAGTTHYTKDGYVVAAADNETKQPAKEGEAAADEHEDDMPKVEELTVDKKTTATATLDADGDEKPAAAAAVSSQPKKQKPTAASKPVEAQAKSAAAVPPEKSTAGPSKEDLGVFETYHEFTEKYADVVEEFMAIPELDKSKDFLLKNGTILLQENASNYLLLASLEDEMNGYRDKMRLTARQSQLVSSIAELAKSLDTHPGNVIVPFFQKLETKDGLAGFMENVESFVQKIIARAVTKKIEMDRERRHEGEEAVDLASVPREERLGPGGLDPLEVIETLPVEMQEAFESRDVSKLKEALLKLDPAEAEQHMKRCIDSGLWVS